MILIEGSSMNMQQQSIFSLHAFYKLKNHFHYSFLKDCNDLPEIILHNKIRGDFSVDKLLSTF